MTHTLESNCKGWTSQFEMDVDFKDTFEENCNLFFDMVGFFCIFLLVFSVELICSKN